MKKISDTVKAVEDVAFWKSCWELPLAIGHGLVAVESSPEITERAAGWIMESDTDAVLEESGSVVGAGLKGSCGIWGNTLFLKEGRVWVEVETSRVGTKGLQVPRRMALSWLSVCV
jgi:hypothetical protein